MLTGFGILGIIPPLNMYIVDNQIPLASSAFRRDYNATTKMLQKTANTNGLISDRTLGQWKSSLFV